MEIIYSKEAKEDIDFWKNSGQSAILKRIRLLLESINENPFIGLGKPEPLKFDLAGKWSRRINAEHRIIYEIMNGEIIVHSLRGHY